MSDFNENDSTTNDCGSSERNSLKPNTVLIDNINSTLNSLIEENKNLKNYKEKILQQKKLVFNSPYTPITLKDYLYRIKSLTEVEDNTLILSLIYIDKICENASIILSEFNIHKILFSSILIAIKFNEDLYYDNKFYAKVAGVSAKELKKMESEFLRLIKFDLYINRKIFCKYKKYISKINNIAEEKALIL
jgi:hypothetical protein